MYDSQLPEAILRRSRSQVDKCGPFHPPLRIFATRLQGTTLRIQSIKFIQWSAAVHDRKQALQNDGHLLYLYHEVGEKLTFHECSTESKEMKDLAP